MPVARTPKNRKVRYAVVGGGWISQAAFMPGVAQTGNSELTALITGDPAKAEALGRRYGLKTFSYAEYRQALDADLFDAVTLTLPNGQHRDVAVPALEAGDHLLLEKPMATSVAGCGRFAVGGDPIDRGRDRPFSVIHRRAAPSGRSRSPPSNGPAGSTPAALLEPTGNIPPAEAEACYRARAEVQALTA